MLGPCSGLRRVQLNWMVIQLCEDQLGYIWVVDSEEVRVFYRDTDIVKHVCSEVTSVLLVLFVFPLNIVKLLCCLLHYTKKKKMNRNKKSISIFILC